MEDRIRDYLGMSGGGAPGHRLRAMGIVVDASMARQYGIVRTRNVVGLPEAMMEQHLYGARLVEAYAAGTVRWEQGEDEYHIARFKDVGGKNMLMEVSIVVFRDGISRERFIMKFFPGDKEAVLPILN